MGPCGHHGYPFGDPKPALGEPNGRHSDPLVPMEPPWLPKGAKSDPLGDQMLPLWEPDGATGEPKRHEASKNVPKQQKPSKTHYKWGDKAMHEAMIQ